MRTLFLDTASAEPAFALCEDEKLILWNPLKTTAEETLIPELETMLKKSGWKLSDLERVACVTGPGGFVSTRVGVSMANALGYALSIPLCGIHLSDLWQARVQTEDVFWLHSTRRHQLFIRGFGGHAKTFPEPKLIELEEAKTLEGVYVGELIPEHRDALSALAPLAEEHIRERKAVLPSFLAGGTYAKTPLIPWYGREA